MSETDAVSTPSLMFVSRRDELENVVDFGTGEDCGNGCKSPLRDAKRYRMDMNFLLNGGAFEQNIDEMNEGRLPFGLGDASHLLDPWNLPSFMSAIDSPTTAAMIKLDPLEPLSMNSHKSPKTTPRTVMTGSQDYELGFDSIEFPASSLDLPPDVLASADNPIIDASGLIHLEEQREGLDDVLPPLIPECVSTCNEQSICNEQPKCNETIPATICSSICEGDSTSAGGCSWSDSKYTTTASDDAESSPRCNNSRESGLKKRVFPCPQCGFVFKMRSNLKRHISTVHEDRRTFVCDICQMSFGLKQNLVTHVRVKHERSRPFVCDKCGMTFGYKQVLQNHVRNIHTRRNG